MNARMPRRTFYAITATILLGMIAGLLEIIYDLVCDGDPTAATSPFGGRTPRPARITDEDFDRYAWPSLEGRAS